MNTCIIVSSALIGVALLVCIIAVVDCTRRVIPPTLVKFRVLAACDIALALTRVSMSGSPEAGGDILTQGVLVMIRSAFSWTMILYFFENFLLVIKTLKLGMGSASAILSKMLTCWTIVRPTLAVIYLALAFAFGLDQTNRVELVRLCVNFTNTVLVLLPVCVVVIRIGFIIRSHRLRLVAESDVEEGSAASRNMELKAAHHQLWILGAALLVLCVFWIYESAGNLGDVASAINEEYAPPECSIGSATYSRLIPMLIAQFLTRCPHAKSKKMLILDSRTRASSGSGASVGQSPRRTPPPVAIGGKDETTGTVDGVIHTAVGESGERGTEMEQLYLNV